MLLPSHAVNKRSVTSYAHPLVLFTPRYPKDRPGEHASLRYFSFYSLIVEAESRDWASNGTFRRMGLPEKYITYSLGALYEIYLPRS